MVEVSIRRKEDRINRVGRSRDPEIVLTHRDGRFGRGSTLRSGDRLPATPRVNQSVGSKNVRVVDGKRGQFLEYPIQLDSLPSAPSEFLSKGAKFAHAHYGRKPDDVGLSKAKLLVCPARPWCLPSEPKQQVRVEQESLHLARWSVECGQQFFDWLITRPGTPEDHRVHTA